MSLPLGNYDPAQQNIIVGGVPIDGFADGTFIKASRDNDTWSYKPSNSGGGARARNPDKSGKFEFTLHQGSPSNNYLTTLAVTDELTGQGVVEVSVVDRTTLQAKCFAAQAWVIKPADYERAKELGDVTWTIQAQVMEIVHDGLVPVT